MTTNVSVRVCVLARTTVRDAALFIEVSLVMTDEDEAAKTSKQGNLIIIRYDRSSCFCLRFNSK